MMRTPKGMLQGGTEGKARSVSWPLALLAAGLTGAVFGAFLSTMMLLGTRDMRGAPTQAQAAGASAVRVEASRDAGELEAVRLSVERLRERLDEQASLLEGTHNMVARSAQFHTSLASTLNTSVELHKESLDILGARASAASTAGGARQGEEAGGCLRSLEELQELTLPTWRDMAKEAPPGKAYAHDIRVATTVVPNSFYFAYTNPRYDVDVSGQMQGVRGVELGLTRMWFHLLEERCRQTDARGRSPLVLDVGANFGWYSILAASLGCDVIAWEPVPHFRSFFELAIAINGLQRKIQVRHRAVSNTTGAVEIVVPQRGIWGTAGVGGWNIDNNVDNEGGLQRLNVRTEPLDDVAAIDRDVAILKVDVEGYEPWVFSGADQLLQGRKGVTVQDIFMEYSPGVMERQQNWVGWMENPMMLQKLIANGYSLRHLHDGVTRNLHAGDYKGKPEAIEEWRKVPSHVVKDLQMVTHENLRYDVEDARRMQKGLMTRGIPEGLNPHSFHSAFGHNTNVWATRDCKDMCGKGDKNIVGVTATSSYGMGGRSLSGGGIKPKDFYTLPPEGAR